MENLIEIENNVDDFLIADEEGSAHAWAAIEISEDGSACIKVGDASGYSHMVEFEAMHRETMRWEYRRVEAGRAIPSVEAAQAMADDKIIRSLVTRIAAGFSVKESGGINQPVLTADAAAAETEMTAIARDMLMGIIPYENIADAVEFLDGPYNSPRGTMDDYGLTVRQAADIGPERAEEIAKQIEDEGAEMGLRIINSDSAVEWMRGMAEEIIKDCTDKSLALAETFESRLEDIDIPAGYKVTVETNTDDDGAYVKVKAARAEGDDPLFDEDGDFIEDFLSLWEEMEDEGTETADDGSVVEWMRFSFPFADADE